MYAIDNSLLKCCQDWMNQWMIKENKKCYLYGCPAALCKDANKLDISGRSINVECSGIQIRRQVSIKVFSHFISSFISFWKIRVFLKDLQDLTFETYLHILAVWGQD